MTYTKDNIQQLRAELGVGIMDAKSALQESKGNMEKAIEILRAKGAKSADKKMSRTTKEGFIGSYVHATGKDAALVALACETDFVARTDDFKNLAHDLALHVVAARPKYLKPEDVPLDVIEKEEKIWREQLKTEGKPEKMHAQIIEGKKKKYFTEVCMLKQPFVKNDEMTVEQIVTAAVTKLGENIQISGFSLLNI